ncbi:MAG: type II secretion system protein [Candidatus Zixiibacteriota bacterium]
MLGLNNSGERSAPAETVTAPDGGFTMIEMAVVIVILGVLATLAIRSGVDMIDDAKHDATQFELEQLARAIVGDERTASAGKRTDYGYVGDIGALPSTLTDLVIDPGFGTWDGPYVQTGPDGGYAADAWGVAYVYTGGVTIQSTGSGSTITKTIGSATSDITSNVVRGAVVDARGVPPGPTYKDSIVVSLLRPDGAGGTTTTTAVPARSGLYTLTGIPIGNHALRAIYIPLADTVEELVSVGPGATVTVNLRFGVALW